MTTGVIGGHMPSGEVLPSADILHTGPAPSTVDFMKSLGLEIPDTPINKTAAIVGEIAVKTEVTSTVDFMKSLGLDIDDSPVKGTKESSTPATATESTSAVDFMGSILKDKATPKTKRVHKATPKHVARPRSIERKRGAKSPSRKIVGTIGAFALVPVLLTGVTVAHALVEKVKKPVTALTAEPLKLQESPKPEAIVSNVAATTPKLEAPTSTTEAPKFGVFEAQPGDVMGTFEIPSQCIKGELRAFDEIETMNSITKKDIYIGDGTHRAQLDQLIHDPNAVQHCEPVEQRAGLGAITRENRFGKDGVGNVNQYVPIFVQGIYNGVPSSVHPGQEGNAVVLTHGSSNSGGGANMFTAQTGDKLIYVQNDKHPQYNQVFEFTKIEGDPEIVPAGVGDTDDSIIHYSHPSFKATVTIYNCSNEQGQTGSGTHRYVTRWGFSGYHWVSK